MEPTGRGAWTAGTPAGAAAQGCGLGTLEGGGGEAGQGASSWGALSRGADGGAPARVRQRGGAAPRVDRLGGTNRGHGPGAQTGDAEGLDQRYRLGAQAWGRGPGT